VPIQIASLFAKIGADTSGLHEGLTETDIALGRTKKNMMTMATSAGALAASFAAVGAAGKMIWETGKQGAAIERAENSFTLLSGSAQEATSNLELLRTATRNTRSDFELMQGAANLMALGLADDATQLGGIMKNVEALGSRFGGTMQIFQLMMSNQSLMRIDSFGIGVEEATQRIDEFKEAGMSAEDAFQTGILELMEEKYVSLGGAVEDSALAYEQLEANFKNITDAMKSQVSEAIGPLVSGYAEFVQESLDADKSMIGFGATLRMVNSLLTPEPFYAYQKAAVDAGEAVSASLTGKMFNDSKKALEELGSTAANASSPIYNSALAVEQYNNAIASADAAAAGAMASGMDIAATAAANLAQNTLIANSQLDEMSAKQFAMMAIEQLETAGVKGQALVDATAAILSQFGILSEKDGDVGAAMSNIAGDFAATGGSADVLASKVWNIYNAIDALPTYKNVVIAIEEQRKYTNVAPSLMDALIDAEEGQSGSNTVIPETLGTSGGQSVNWNGSINVNGAGDPQSTANAVIQKLQDRGIIHSGGYR